MKFYEITISTDPDTLELGGERGKRDSKAKAAFEKKVCDINADWLESNMMKHHINVASVILNLLMGERYGV